MARKKGERQRPTLRKGSSSARKSNPAKFILPRPVGRVNKLSTRSYSARDRALHALASMRRHGFSFTRAAREAGVTKRTMKFYVGSALLQDSPGKRIHPTASDRFVRSHLNFPTLDGTKKITIQGSKTASEAARYLNAIKAVLSGENLHALDEFKGKKIAGIELITDIRTLKHLAEVEELSIESLYRSISGGAA